MLACAPQWQRPQHPPGARTAASVSTPTDRSVLRSIPMSATPHIAARTSASAHSCVVNVETPWSAHTPCHGPDALGADRARARVGLQNGRSNSCAERVRSIRRQLTPESLNSSTTSSYEGPSVHRSVPGHPVGAVAPQPGRRCDRGARAVRSPRSGTGAGGRGWHRAPAVHQRCICRGNRAGPAGPNRAGNGQKPPR